MFIYRLHQAYQLALLTIPYQTVRQQLEHIPVKAQTQSYNLAAFVLDANEFRRLMKLVGWDGTTGGEMRCFYVPSPHALLLGFIQQNGSSPHVFVGSPVALPFLDDDAVDMTDSEAVPRTIAKMEGKDWTEGLPIHHRGWTVSKAGNLWTMIEGTHCSVINLGPGHFAGLLRGGGSNSIRTREFLDAQSVTQYIERSYHELIKPWTKGIQKYVDTPSLNIEADDTDIAPAADDEEDFNLS